MWKNIYTSMWCTVGGQSMLYYRLGTYPRVRTYYRRVGGVDYNSDRYGGMRDVELWSGVDM